MNTISGKKHSFAHIVNPVAVGPESDLFIAQPVTFESMRVARELAGERCDIEFYSAQYSEDHSGIPEYFIKTPDLERSMIDLGDFLDAKKLPVLKDILDRLYAVSDAEYFIYTNVDIALMPHFYSVLSNMIESGLDGVVINRRTISDNYSRIDELPMMYAEVGQPHYGYDCFIFKRDSYPQFDLGETCIGAMAIGSVLLLNIACFSREFREFRELHMTFHVGNTEVWRNPKIKDTQQFNQEGLRQVCRRLADKFDLDRLPTVGQPSLQKYFDFIKSRGGK